MKSLLLLLVATLLAGCPWNAAGNTGCQMTGSPRPLPEAIHESSGLAQSLMDPEVIWTHNDGGDPVLYAVNLQGHLLGTLTLAGTRMWDWEDLAAAPCGAGACIYLADTGDNMERRSQVQILRVQDPGVPGEEPLEAQTFPVRLPDGPRDIEALFVLPGEQIHLVTKGRNHANTVYRYPLPLRPDEVVTLEEVQTLSDGAMPIPAQVTGADASADGRLVVLRTYQDLTFYRVENGLLIPMDGGRVALRTLEEPQGEAVAFSAQGQVLLSTEAGNFGGIAALRVLECQITVPIAPPTSRP